MPVAKAKAATAVQTVAIKPPNIEHAEFLLIGESPLVIHRFSHKIKQKLKEQMELGKPSGSRTTREPRNTDELYDEARYRSPEGWDGCHAGAFRNALISACRLVGFKMTLAKLSVFVYQDGWDAKERQIPLVRIYGEPVKQEDVARVANGNPYITVRAAFHDWKIRLHLRYDADQFTLSDMTNLLWRAGLQVGVGEGRPDSPDSAGMGWGTFRVAMGEEL